MKSNKKTDQKRYHITITDLYTGATITDTDSGAIIGAIDSADRIQGVAAVCCNTSRLINVIETAEKVVKNCKSEVVKDVVSDILKGEEDDE